MLNNSQTRAGMIALLMLCLVMIGCTSSPPGTTAVSEPVSITFYKRGYVEGAEDVTSTTNAQAVAAFEAANPHIHVDIVGVPWTAEGDALLDEALASGEKIHVFSALPGSLIQLSKEGKVSPIEPFMSEEDKTDFYANGLQAATVDGEVVAWPIWVVALSTFINTAIFAERGVDIPSLEDPWTWEEFVEAAEQLTFDREDGTHVDGITASSAWWAVDYYPLLYVDGGRILSPDGKRFVLNQREALSGLQKAADLRNLYGVTPDDFGAVKQLDVWEQFKNGETAMLMSTPALIAELEEMKFPLAVVPPPMGDLNQVVTTGQFGMYGVYNVDDEAELAAAHEFAKYITGSQVPLDVPGYQLAPSLRRSNTSYATTPNREMVSRLVEYGVFEAPADISTEMGDLFGAALKAVVLGEKTPQKAMAEIAPLYQAELDASWGE